MAGGVKEQAAAAAAQQWLARVDQEDYAGSWQEAAEYFRNAVPPEQWEQSMRAVRKPLGALVSRQVAGTTYATSLPGGPDGEYVVVRFQTSFAHKQAAVETVTPMLQSDGAWRVSGYYIA